MNDPFVNEVRQSRHEHAQQFHDDVSAMCDDVRNIHATCGQAVVTWSHVHRNVYPRLHVLQRWIRPSNRLRQNPCKHGGIETLEKLIFPANRPFSVE